MQWFAVEAHLARARAHLTAPMPEALFYAALEFRYAVESRLMDYSEAADEFVKNKKGRFSAGALNGHLIKTYRDYARDPVTYVIEIRSPRLSAPCVIKHTPVHPAALKILGLTDNYLHAAGMLDCRKDEVSRKLKELLMRGIELMEQAVAGGMQGPAIMPNPGKGHIIVDSKKHPELVQLLKVGEPFEAIVSYEPLPEVGPLESPSKGLT